MNMMSTSAPVSEYDLEAYIDNELDWERAKAVLAQIEQDAQFRRKYEELRQQKQLLNDWWKNSQFN